MIKAIIFDCFGVLTTDVWLAFCDSLPEGVDVQKARDLNRAVDSGIISREEYLSGVKEITGKEPPDIETMGAPAKNQALLSYIKELKGLGYKLGILSNVSSSWITDDLLTNAEAALFDDITLSYNTGFIKPDAQIYELACQRLGVDPKEAVMIDDREWYVEGAKAVGMRGIQYSDLASLKEQLGLVLKRQSAT